MRLARVALILCATAAPALGQTLAGSLTDSATRQPIAGAVITLLDSTGGVLGRLLTSDRGAYHVAQAAAVRRLRLQRLGYRMRDVRVPTSNESSIRLDIRLVALPSLLDPVETMASSQCPKRADGPKAFSLLEQARAALLNTIVAREQNPGRMVRLQYERLLNGDEILRQQVRVDSTESAKTSFTAVYSGSGFVRNGFMDGKGAGQRFYGPDAEVMLDDGFAAGYCFRIADRDRDHPSDVGLSFSAADRKRGRVDIDGTLWVDTLARKLRRIEYKYVGLPSGVRGRADGVIGFHDVPNGVVFIDRWFIRLPEQEQEVVAGMLTSWWAGAESGGEVARASWPDGASWKSSLGTLAMVALHHDSTAAPGTTVRLIDTDYLGVADKDGNVVITDLLPGPYKAAVVDTLLAAAHILPDPIFKFTAVRDSTVATTFEVKTAADYAWERCNAGKRSRSLQVLLLGKIENGGGHPVPNAVIEFADVGVQPFTKFKTGDDGVFSLCLPASARGQGLAVWFRGADGNKRSVVVTLVRELTTMLINVDGR
jgi:hypothetical protein